MSWLRPDSAAPSDYDPERKVTAMVEKLGPESGRILQAFNESDPLGVYYGNNPDEYVGYVNRFFAKLGSRTLADLSDQEVRTLVEGSFHASQREQGWLDAEDVEHLVERIIALQKPAQ